MMYCVSEIPLFLCLYVVNVCYWICLVQDVVISCRRAVMALAVNPLVPYQLAIGCSDNWVRVYDQRMLGLRSATGSLCI